MPAHLSEISNKSLSKQALDVLRAAILDGALRPGTTLVETELADRLGVSRAPVREALRILNAEGLVEAVPYHGTKVRALSRVDIEEIYSLRATLETFAVQRLMHGQAASMAVEQLRARYDELLAAARAGDARKVGDADTAFHRALVALSGHGLLLTTWNSIHMRVRQVMALVNGTDHDLIQTAHSHVAMIDAIALGDETQAVIEVQAHVTAMGRLMAENWEDLEPPAD